MGAITKEQVRRIYALGAAAGVLESGNKDDNLHAIVMRVTGKGSVKDLSDGDFYNVERELLPLLQGKSRRAPLPPAATDNTPAGRMNKAQQRLAWRYIYRLIELDDKKSKATAGERMVGVIKKELLVDATVEEPFRWLTPYTGGQLIEKLKRYVASAERRKERSDGNRST